MSGWENLAGWDEVTVRPIDRWPGGAVGERLRSKIQLDEETGCWLWTGEVNRRGYGRVRIGGVRTVAHRAVYELLVGPVPEGHVLDHVRARGCRYRRCVNPAHLEPVTGAENTRRGDSPAAAAARATACPQGHPYNEANTRTYRGRRYCRECNRNGGTGRREALRATHPDRGGDPDEFRAVQAAREAGAS